ncbi:MAG: recombination mediator RecR [bacterium]|nr:recombination mediator RecR [bacterium]
MQAPQAIRNLVESFEKLPGIGPKTAQRLTFYLLHVPQDNLEEFAKALENLKKNTILCSICKNVAEVDPCPVCSDVNRDKGVVMVVEQPLDVLALEQTGKYKGVYHVLHGAINPLENIGPDEIFIRELVKRVVSGESRVSELILATNPTMEGEATAMYIARQLKTHSPQGDSRNAKVKITRLGLGLPTGADIEYADEMTLREAIEGRREF